MTLVFLPAGKKLEKCHSSGLKESWLLGFTLKSVSDGAWALFPEPQSQEPAPLPQHTQHRPGWSESDGTDWLSWPGPAPLQRG